jgi:ribosome-associated protein
MVSISVRTAPDPGGGRNAGSVCAIERDVRIHSPGITLGQLLKLAGLIDSGAEAKAFLRTGQVWVNGEPEARRGRKLALGDVVRVGELELRLTSADLDIRRPDREIDAGRADSVGDEPGA